MKKVASILLILLYAATSSGASFHLHFCMGQFQGIGFAANKNQACDKCGMDRSGNGCCKDVVKTFKASTDQSASNLNFELSLYACALPVSTIYSLREALIAKERPVLFATGPPEPAHLPLFLRIRNFRI